MSNFAAICADLLFPSTGACGFRATVRSSRTNLTLLTEIQLDEIAGGAGVTALAGGSGQDVTARVAVRITPGDVSVGHSFAIAFGDSTTASATVNPTGDTTHVESNSLTTPSGISLAQANGVGF